VDHLESVVPWGAQATITADAAWPGWTTATDGPALTAARQVMADVYGAPAGLIGSGGSIPLLTTLQQLNPDAEFVLWGAEDGAQANIHSADESVDLTELGRAALAETLLLARLGVRG
jgi:acetylornithine deacetylase/succinyl-diaminopimelate desuccinylase-like protein